MQDFISFFQDVFERLCAFPFEKALIVILGCFLALSLLSLILCIAMKSLHRLSRAPYLWLVNIFTALLFALVYLHASLTYAVLSAVLLWVTGVIFYGILCLTRRQEETPHETALVNYLPSSPPKGALHPSVPAATADVRLDHALSITDRLLAKTLTKGDRGEVEKIRSYLSVLSIKGTLSPEEGEALNESFNTLLKLMAKYNL